jgi:flagellar FliL protein
MADAPKNNPPAADSKANNATANVNVNKMTTYIILGMFVLLITVIIAGAFLIFTFKSSVTSQAPITRAPEVNTTAAEEVGPLVPLGNEIIVNIPSDDGVERYLKVNATLELDNEKAKEEITKRIPQIRDLMISILRTKTKEKIDEKEGKDQIRSEIIDSINHYLVTGKVKNLYFEDFLIN